MKLSAILLGALLLASTAVHAQDVAAPMTEAEIKQAIIDQSIAQTPGNCPCPYHRASNGSRCGGRSSYSRAGGYGPVCYASDVTPAMVEQYKRRNPQATASAGG